MFKDTLFLNHADAEKAGRELARERKELIIPDLIENLVRITHEKIQNIHHNLKLYETFINSYYGKINKYDK